MKNNNKMLAVIPARGGSKGLPGKNIRPFAGLPLIVHTIQMARMCARISRVIVSTDDEKIAKVAREHGGDVPFLRPKELAQDETPMWPVLRHALQTIEEEKNERYDYFLLLDPTSPGRIPEDIEGALASLQKNPKADGIVGVSQPEFNPIWHCVVEENGWMANLIDGGFKYPRRQDVPPVYRINASLYLWKAEFVRRCQNDCYKEGRHLIYEVPESRSIHIDEIHEFKRAELLVREGLIKFPWLKN